MKLGKLTSVISCAVILISMVSCSGISQKTGDNSSSSENDSSSFTSNEPSSSVPADSKPVSSALAEAASNAKVNTSGNTSRAVSGVSSLKLQKNNEWTAYDDAKHNLHIKKTDGTEDKIIVKDIDLAPCVAGEWVYYFPNLSEIDKVRLDGLQKTKVCYMDAMDALNANTEVIPEYKNGYILYKLTQLREAGNNSANTVTYYKLDLSKNKITLVKNK